MSDRRMTVHEVADLTGITIRTLHYYDEIGLLKPTMVTDSKYRLYTDDDLSRLQEILFFREVGFALKEIKSLLGSPNYDRTEALKRHLDILQVQNERIDALISLVKTEIEGNPVPSFAPFSETKVLELKEKYRSEVLERWGDTDSFKEYESIFSSKSRRSQTEQMERFIPLPNLFLKSWPCMRMNRQVALQSSGLLKSGKTIFLLIFISVICKCFPI